MANSIYQNKKITFFVLLFISIMSFSFLATSKAVENDNNRRQNNSTSNNLNATRITADKMSYIHNKNQVAFSGDVYVNRQAFQLWCDDLLVYLSSRKNSLSTSDASGTIKDQTNFEKIVAKKNVRIKMEGRTAESSRATYETDPRVLILEGDVVLREGPNKVAGEIVKLYLDQNKSEIIGGKQEQIEALFYPSSEREQD